MADPRKGPRHSPVVGGARRRRVVLDRTARTECREPGDRSFPGRPFRFRRRRLRAHPAQPRRVWSSELSASVELRTGLRPMLVVVGVAAGLSSGAALVATITLGWSLALSTAFIAVPALVAAGKAWWWGIAFALFLEGMMVTLYPGWLRVPLTTEFLTLSVSGHFIYGSILGVLARRAP